MTTTTAAPPRANPNSLEEATRLAALHDLGVLDSLPEPVFDAIVASAAQACGVPIALISLVDAHRQWFKAGVGLPGVSETPRRSRAKRATPSFCSMPRMRSLAEASARLARRAPWVMLRTSAT